MRIYSFSYIAIFYSLADMFGSPGWAEEVDKTRAFPLLRTSRYASTNSNADESTSEKSYFWNRLLSQSYLASYAYGTVRLSSSNKEKWPECIEKKLTCDECKDLIIKENNPAITKVEILGENDPATYDLRVDRVRIFCNEETNTVAVIPYTG